MRERLLDHPEKVDKALRALQLLKKVYDAGVIGDQVTWFGWGRLSFDFLSWRQAMPNCNDQDEVLQHNEVQDAAKNLKSLIATRSVSLCHLLQREEIIHGSCTEAAAFEVAHLHNSIQRPEFFHK